MSNTTFVDYYYTECSVKALPLTAEYVEAIVEALSVKAAEMEIGSLTVDWSGGTGVPTITYRYMSETTDWVLTEGMYLVIIQATGRMKAMTADDFVAAYTAGTHELVDTEDTGSGDTGDTGSSGDTGDTGSEGSGDTGSSGDDDTNAIVGRAIVGKAILSE